LGNSSLVSDWKARPLLHPRYGDIRISTFGSGIPHSPFTIHHSPFVIGTSTFFPFPSVLSAQSAVDFPASPFTIHHSPFLPAMLRIALQAGAIGIDFRPRS
jgi:hypothetical protein